MSFFNFSWREKLFVSWVGLRGAIPIVLATFPLVAGIEGAERFFNIVFFVVLISMLLQGSTCSWLARLFKLEESVETVSEVREDVFMNATIAKNSRYITIGANDLVAGMQLVDLHLSQGVLVVAVERDEETIIPRGGTELEVGDRLWLMGEDIALKEALAFLGRQVPAA